MRSRLTHDRTRQWIFSIAALLIVTLPLLYAAIIVPLSPREQAVAALALIALAAFASFSQALRPLIVFLSCFASMRYFYWRVSSTLHLDTPLDRIVSAAAGGRDLRPHHPVPGLLSDHRSYRPCFSVAPAASDCRYLHSDLQ
jgi:hypothetical protein